MEWITQTFSIEFIALTYENSKKQTNKHNTALKSLFLGFIIYRLFKVHSFSSRFEKPAEINTKTTVRLQNVYKFIDVLRFESQQQKNWLNILIKCYSPKLVFSMPENWKIIRRQSLCF